MDRYEELNSVHHDQASQDYLPTLVLFLENARAVRHKAVEDML
jgi:hypothetical protein